MESGKKGLTSKCTFGYEINSNLSNIDSPADLHIIFRGDVGFSKQFHCTGSVSETHNLENNTVLNKIHQNWIFSQKKKKIEIWKSLQN